MNKILILVRHAHREKMESDNGLSAKGRVQAQAVSDRLKALYPKAKPFLASSPKKRCIETLLPFAGGNAKALTIMPELDEGTNATLERRIQAFTEWWETEAPELTIACSHGDWIPECIETMTHQRVELRKGGWAELEQKEDGAVSLRWVIQQF